MLVYKFEVCFRNCIIFDVILYLLILIENIKNKIMFLFFVFYVHGECAFVDFSICRFVHVERLGRAIVAQNGVSLVVRLLDVLPKVLAIFLLGLPLFFLQLIDFLHVLLSLLTFLILFYQYDLFRTVFDVLLKRYYFEPHLAALTLHSLVFCIFHVLFLNVDHFLIYFARLGK